MDGMHDLGGKQGFGRVRHSLRAQTFHEPWEKRVNALYSLAVKLGIFNMDEYRHAIERMEPRHYLSASYYERSLTSLATLCVEKGIVTREELERRAEGQLPARLAERAGPLQRGGARALQAGRPGRVRTDHVPGHVRMPGYIRGKTGVVVGDIAGLPLPRRPCARRDGRGRADLRCALQCRGTVAQLGRSGLRACRRVPELSGTIVILSDR